MHEVPFKPDMVARRNAEIVRLRKAGWPEVWVARQLDCPVVTVREVWRYLGGP